MTTAQPPHEEWRHVSEINLREVSKSTRTLGLALLVLGASIFLIALFLASLREPIAVVAVAAGTLGTTLVVLAAERAVKPRRRPS
jgi:hypothetical protein